MGDVFSIVSGNTFNADAQRSEATGFTSTTRLKGISHIDSITDPVNGFDFDYLLYQLSFTYRSNMKIYFANDLYDLGTYLGGFAPQTGATTSTAIIPVINGSPMTSTLFCVGVDIDTKFNTTSNNTLTTPSSHPTTLNFTVGTGLEYLPNMLVTLYSSYLQFTGSVTSYTPSTGSITIYCTGATGTGSFADWVVRYGTYLNQYTYSTTAFAIPTTGTSVTFTIATGLTVTGAIAVYPTTISISGTATTYNSGTGAISVSTASNYLSGTTSNWYMILAGGYWFEVDEINLYEADPPNYPACKTTYVDSYTATGATIHGLVNPYALSSTAQFEWGTTIGYGTTTTAIESPVAGVDGVPVSAIIPLTSGSTSYHYRTIATNSMGSNYGLDVPFFSGNIPIAYTIYTTNNTLTGITFNGTVNPRLLSTTVDFEWGLTTAYTNNVSALENPITGNTSVYCHNITVALSTNQNYFLRIKATNGLGTVYKTGLTISTWDDSFETTTGATPPVNWDIELVSGTITGITFETTSTNPSINGGYDGAQFAKYNSYSINGGSSRLKKTLSYNSVGKTGATVNFAWYEDSAYSSSPDKVEVQWSTNGSSWTTAGSAYNRYNAVTGWKTKSQTLPGGALGQPTLYIGFLFTSAYGNNCYLDFVQLVMV